MTGNGIRKKGIKKGEVGRKATQKKTRREGVGRELRRDGER